MFAFTPYWSFAALQMAEMVRRITKVSGVTVARRSGM